MKRLLIQFTAVCLSAGCLGAQAPRANVPGASTAAAGCKQTSGGSLRTLPEPLLDELERMSGSVFVQAFLLNFVATTGDTNNWLTKCALAFIRAPLDSAALVQGQVSVTTIIRELRAADSAAKVTRDIKQRDDATLRTIARQLLEEPTLARFEGTADFYRRANQRLCVNARSAYCVALSPVVAWYDSVSVRHQRMDSVYSLAETAARAAGRLSENLAAVARGGVADTAQLDQAKAVQGDTSLVKAAMRSRDSLIASLNGQREQLLADHGALVEAGERLELALDSATTRLENWLRNFSVTPPIDLTAELKVRDVDEVERGRSARSVSFSAEPPQRISEPAAAAPANVLMAFTDFIVDRAKQELILAYMADVYSWIRREPMLQIAFPETYELMRSLLSDPNSRDISEVSIGRLSLATWQATFVSDFRAMPIKLLAASPSLICGKYVPRPPDVRLAGDQRGTADAAKAQPAATAAAALSSCESNVLAMQPLSEAARRVLGGEPVFNVLRDLHNIAQETWGQQSTELRRLTQGLAVMHALADAYYLQGNVENPDPLRHPYVVSLDALTQMPTLQRDAFVRLMLLRVVAYGPAPVKLDAARLPRIYGAVLDIARSVETLREPPGSGQTAREQAARIVHQAFVAARSSADIAVLLANSTDSARIATDVRNWSQFADAIDPIVANNYGLAMARTAVLMKNVFDARLSRPALALTSLAAGLAEAQNGEQMRSAFEAAAAPVGGWRAKRYHEGGRVSITAFPGFALGREYVTKGGFGTSSVGIALPVGIDWQWTHRNDDLRERAACVVGVCSLGMVFSVMDLGALLSYRVKGSDEVTSDVDPSLRQVFAPGLMFSFGVGRTPLAILLGGQYMPQLRNVTTAGSTGTADAYRFAALFTLDLKLFDF